MARGSKEFKRRIKKMQKHVEALRYLELNQDEEGAVDEIQVALNDLGEFREQREREMPPEVGVAG